MGTTPIQDALDYIENLTPEEQEVVADILHNRLIEKRRNEIAANAKETLHSFEEGNIIAGSLDDLKKDLLSE